jgi:hypothetical protein
VDFPCFGYRPDIESRLTIQEKWVLVRDEVDRIFESVMSEVCGTEFDPDDKDGKFLD